MSSSRSKPPTKSQMMKELATKTGLKTTEVKSVFDALEVMIASNLKKHKEFNMMGLLKLKIKRKEATKAHPGRNPFTGEKMIFKAKPAKNVVKVRTLKKLKDMA